MTSLESDNNLNLKQFSCRTLPNLQGLKSLQSDNKYKIYKKQFDCKTENTAIGYKNNDKIEVNYVKSGYSILYHLNLGQKCVKMQSLKVA